MDSGGLNLNNLLVCATCGEPIGSTSSLVDSQRNLKLHHDIVEGTQQLFWAKDAVARMSLGKELLPGFQLVGHDRYWTKLQFDLEKEG